jgi:hypothetical protein
MRHKMAVINAKLVEIEVQEQMYTNEDNAANKYMVHIKYEKDEFGPIETASIVLTNTKPIIKYTIDTGNTVAEKDELSY